MAYGSAGSLGSAGVNTGGGNCVITTGATAEAGNLVVVLIAKDNVNGDSGTTSEITSVTGSNGDVFASAGRRVSNDAANAGSYVDIYYKRLTSQLASGGTITIVKTTDVDCAAIAWEFTCSADSSVVGTPQTGEGNASSTPSSLTLSGLSNVEHLFIRATAQESELTAAWTNTANYTDMGVAASTTVGSTDVNITIRGEFRILTATGDTSAPTTLPEPSDHVSVYIALEEAVASGTGLDIRQFPRGVLRGITRGAA